MADPACEWYCSGSRGRYCIFVGSGWVRVCGSISLLLFGLFAAAVCVLGIIFAITVVNNYQFFDVIAVSIAAPVFIVVGFFLLFGRCLKCERPFWVCYFILLLVGVGIFFGGAVLLHLDAGPSSGISRGLCVVINSTILASNSTYKPLLYVTFSLSTTQQYSGMALCTDQPTAHPDIFPSMQDAVNCLLPYAAGMFQTCWWRESNHTVEAWMQVHQTPDRSWMALLCLIVFVAICACVAYWMVAARWMHAAESRSSVPLPLCCLPCNSPAEYEPLNE